MIQQEPVTLEQIRQIVREEVERAMKKDPAARQACFIASKGTLDWAYPPLILSTAAAAAFPIVLGYIGDRYPHDSGTAFSAIFVVALVGKMAINKAFGYVAQIHGIEQYARVMLVLLAASAAMLYFVVRQLNLTKPT